MRENKSSSSDQGEKGRRNDAADWGFGRPLFKNPWFYFALVCIAVITVSRPLLRSVPPPLPVLKVLPSFKMIDENGEELQSEELKGTPYVASFLFTRCPDICPMVAQKVSELQNQLQRGRLPVRLVSFTVDPKYDRPAQLLEYGKRFSARPGVWRFLTSHEGKHEDYLQFIETTFGVAVGRPSEAEEPMTAIDIAHTEKLLLIDARGRLRGYFESTADGINEIFHRSVSLMGEGDGPSSR